LGVFFFSSRRRHTRFSRDWSSDVCSSDLCRVAITVGDLVEMPQLKLGVLHGAAGLGRPVSWTHTSDLPAMWRWVTGGELVMTNRSEERRVGKEWGARRSAVHLGARGGRQM